MRRPLGRFMVDPAPALPAQDLLGLEVGPAEAVRLSADEAALIERCLSGESSAFDQLVNRYQDMVYNLALRLLGRPEDALDLAQEVFFQVYRKLASFRRDASLRTWIYRIVVNRAKNRQRWWRRRIREMTARAVEEIERDGAWELSALVAARASIGSPDEALRRKELGKALRQAMAALPLEQRTVLVLKEVEGLSYEEIASSLQLALGTVKSRLARARVTLRRELKPEL